ncbi:MAG: N-acetylmuramidase domain-containing protein [Candidatus Gracilibacteria bacterium]|nr:N-acetylmuramidase domain-containing protein [Candidatus Gracilibacteria bacterium]MDQ7023204.1 N-acetylmuramidase domain-containing protein [Candidatus Gracilibacteria bacterium]
MSFETFIPHEERNSLEETNKDVNTKMKDFFSSIENENDKEKVKSFFGFINGQKVSYFEDNEEGINQFEIDKEKFISENSSFYENSFDALLNSLKERRLLVCELEKSLKQDNFEGDESDSKEIQESFENFIGDENKSFDKLLSLPRDVRVKLCTRQKINIEDIMDGEVSSLIFDFKFGGEKMNKDIYLNTTAGQLLPAEVKTVIKDGVVYFRSGQLGEFFTENNKRLTIHQDTHITISNLQSTEDVLKENKIIKVKLGIDLNLEKNNLSNEELIKLEASLRGIDPEFAFIAFGDILEETSEEKREYILENMLTEFDRIRGYYKLDNKINDKLDDNSALRLFYNLDSSNYEKNSKKYGIDESKITKKESMGEYLNFSKIDGINDIAKKLDIPENILYAICMNESSGKGLGKALPRFEKHIFDRYMNGKWKYKGRKPTNSEANMLSRSYGGMQVMGFNYKKVGYSTIEEFVEAQTGSNSEKEQLKAFANFLKNTPGMVSAMKSYDYEKIARLYNGTNHAQNNYVGKLKKYVNRYS